MKAKTRRIKDSLKIEDGKYFELYTPASGRIVSPALGKRLKYAKIYLSADANVTFKDEAGGSSSTVALAKGRHDFMVTEISVVSTGSVYIIHDGVLSTAHDE